jgi:ABC-type branched-subunit amino acid transport system ATPase component
LRISDRGYILSKGQIVYEGTIEKLRESKEAMKHLIL